MAATGITLLRMPLLGACLLLHDGPAGLAFSAARAALLADIASAATGPHPGVLR